MIRFNIVLVAALFGLVAVAFRPPETAPSAEPDSSGGHEVGSLSDPDDCLVCHDDESFTMVRGGREISLFVDPDLFDASPHGGFDCIDCHVGYDPDEEPHREGAGPVDCAMCHDDVSAEYSHSSHASQIICTACHRDVHTPEGAKATVETCQSCHKDAGADLALSAHAGNHFAPTCLSCHAPHRFRPADSQTCLTCHGEREFAAKHVAGEDVEAVLSYEESIHGDLIECSDCHTGHKVLGPDDPNSGVSRQHIAETCAKCHDDVAALYETSEHGKALASGFEMAPACTDCHGEHDIQRISNSESPVSRTHEVQVCLSCHANSPEVEARMTHSTNFIEDFESSVHGQPKADGSGPAAVCSDCHGAHEAMKAANPDAKINKFTISATCGQCHEEEHEVFDSSIHGQALARGIDDAPTCTTCHSEHNILATSNANAPVARSHVSEEVCAPCHESAALSEKYGFPSDRTASFSDSYHGLAGRFGSSEAANCSSCHGIHDIWPSSDPRSRVNPANLQKTCGACHPGANANFARGSVHVSRSAPGDSILYWIGTIYLIIIVATIGSMTVHNTLDWVRKTMIRYRESEEAPAERQMKYGTKPRFFERMTLSERIQHVTLAGSFTVLVITGFMLKFPDAWWVVSLRALIGERLFDLRGILHRVAAVVMVADGLYHVYYLIFVKRGRQIVKDIWFARKDWSDLVQMVKFYFGRSEERPRFDRFNYIEKSEYWALIWGTVVMSLTGFVLWFENHFMAQYSKLFVDVNETIHYWEAWLAFLAIVVWHFYYVIFNPDVYPMNFTWITGKISEKEMEHEHPLELERILREEERAETEETSEGDDPALG